MSDKSQNDVLMVNNNDNFIDKIKKLEFEVNALTEEKKNIEIEFGFKRAKLKEIMLKKEEEMNFQKEIVNKKLQDLKDNLEILKKELDESKSLLVVSKFEKENEIEFIKQKYNAEMAFLRTSYEEKLENFKNYHEQTVENLKKSVNDKIEIETNTNIKNQLKNESMLSVVTKSLKQKVGSLNTSLNTSSNNSLIEDKKLSQRNSIKEQDEEFDFILPLAQEETKMLKEKLRNTDKKLNSYEKILKILITEFSIEKICELINASSNPEETFETVNKFKEEYLKNQKIETTLQLDDKDSILANLLCEQANLRNENEKLIKKISQISLNNNKKNFLNYLSANKLIKSQSLSDLNNLKVNCHFVNVNKKVLKNEEEKLKPINKICEMCSNYELQLQTLQDSESELIKKIENSEKQLQISKEEFLKEKDFRNQIEEQFIQQAKDCNQKIEELKTKLNTASYEINQMKVLLKEKFSTVKDRLDKLNNINVKLHKMICDLQNENNKLLGRFIMKSKDLQREVIDLPQTLEDLQFHCLKLREDLISMSVAKEKLEEDIKIKLLLIKEQQKSDYLSNKSLEESLNSENESLKIKLNLAKKELNNLKTVHEEHENLFKQTGISMQNYEKRIEELEFENSELNKLKTQFEKDINELKFKFTNLQKELEVSQTVQKDFVELSQSLQIELEQYRQTSNEIKYHHDDGFKKK